MPAFFRCKASARESHQTQNASVTGKPSKRTGPVRPGVVEPSMEGLRRLLPEPAPSPRPCIACQGATPGKHIETNMTFCQLPSKQDISTWQAVGHFYLALTCQMRKPVY